MFCPTCGASNPEEARFCNQCGASVAAAAPSEPGTLRGAGSPKSAQGAPSSSLRGGGTLDRVELPLAGPSRRTLAAVAALTGVLGIALGAAVAYRSTRPAETIPVTPVGLIGEPAVVVALADVDAGAAPSRGGARPARTTPPRRPGEPTQPAATPPTARPANAASATPGGEPAAPGEPQRPGSTPTAPGEPATPERPAAGAARDAGAGGSAAALPPDENGVVERGPRVTRGGYTLGDETDATGTMDPRVFSFVYNNYRSQISACYSSASRTRSVSGVIVLRVRIGLDGRVASTRVMSDTARVPQLTQCVQTAVRAWRYPQPEGGEVEVDYPMRFGSSS